MKGVSGYGEHWVPIALRIIKSVQQVDSTGTRCCQTNTQAAGVFRIAESSECRRLFMPHLNEFQFLLMRPQPFKQAIDAIARKAENRIHAPGNQALKKDICNLLVHGITSSSGSLLGNGSFGISEKRWAETAARDAVKTRIQ